MDLRDLDGKAVLGVLFQPDARAVRYIRGVAAWTAGELRVITEVGEVYPVPASFASVAQVITESVRETAPAAIQGLLAGTAFVIPIPPPGGGSIALAVTPGWPSAPAT